MKYIEKNNIPDYFRKEIITLSLELENEDKTRRKIFDSLRCKSELHEYLLMVEQKMLCGYCEAKIKDINKSHIEHVEPIKNAKELVFDYYNLIVSCNGTCFNDENKRLTCGHRKDTKGYKPNYNLFLSPTKVHNIREYFIYTSRGLIGSSNFKKDFSLETLKVLNLNDPNNKLPEERMKSLVEFNKSIQKYSKRSGKSITYITKKLLDKENLAFISFLRFKYKGIL